MSRTISLAELRAQFATAHWPRIEAISQADARCVIDLYIAPEVTWLEGHFPQQPVVAGVVQTHWAGEIGNYLFAPRGTFHRIDNLKFQNVMLPEQPLQLILEHTVAQDTCAIKFRYSRGDDTIFSEGKLVFHHSPSLA